MGNENKNELALQVEAKFGPFLLSLPPYQKALHLPFDNSSDKTLTAIRWSRL